MWDLLLDCVKGIFALLDTMVVFIIEWLYQLIIAIANTNVFGNLIYHYLGRIYTFLGIFMIFKLSISVITYIINPDALTDKSKGFGKLISNVVISLILLVATPTLFDVAFDIQSDLLSTNAVYQIVTGKKLSSSGTTLIENAKITAKQISFGVFSSFVYKGDDGASPDCDTTESEGCKNGTCLTIENNGSTKCLLDWDTVTDNDNTYWWLLSTAVGLVVAYILLTFCFDAALRSVKLGFLQIVAPIPIMLRMDPGAKDDKFSKWLKEVSSTFLSLFIRLAGLFFVTEIIRLVINEHERQKYNMFTQYAGSSPTGLLNVFTKLFIIIGCLMFAKKLPQLISDLFGIKLDGDGFSLKKKMSGVPGMGVAKTLGAGALGFAGGMAANTYGLGSKMWNARKAAGGPGAFKSLTDGEKGWKGFSRVMGNLNSGIAGAGSAAYRGMVSKDKNMFKAASGGIKGAVDKRDIRDKRNEAGYGLGTRMMDSVRTFSGVDTVAKARGIEIANNIVDMRRQQAQFDRLAEQIAQDAGWDASKIETVSKAPAGTYAAGTDEAKYIDYINRSTKLSVQIKKSEKKQAIFQKEASKK